jgi:hypothetical protein
LSRRLDLLLLQDAQELGLQGWRHVADLVEEEGAAVGQLELAAAALAVGAGVGPGATPKNSARAGFPGWRRY